MNTVQKRTYLLVLIFSLAMGFLEAVVVVYLRKIVYPQGFEFPLVLLPSGMFYTELSREAATLVMLVTLAWLAGKTRLERLAFFLFAFAVWDIVYYAGLELLLHWPPSLMTRDILFLIPLPWVSPVLAPLICSATMILLAFLLTVGQGRNPGFRLRWIEWELLVVGALVIVCSFLWEYARFLLSVGITDPGSHVRAALERYNPQAFPWILFLFGEVLILLSLAFIRPRAFRKPHS